MSTRFSGKHILSVDGSRLVLSKTKELEKIYGKTKNQIETYSVQAKTCAVYDVLNKIAIGGILSSVDTDERIQAKQLFKYCRKGDLIIYDRGFASFDFIYEHAGFLKKTKMPNPELRLKKKYLSPVKPKLNSLSLQEISILCHLSR